MAEMSARCGITTTRMGWNWAIYFHPGACGRVLKLQAPKIASQGGHDGECSKTSVSVCMGRGTTLGPLCGHKGYRIPTGMSASLCKAFIGQVATDPCIRTLITGQGICRWQHREGPVISGGAACWTPFGSSQPAEPPCPMGHSTGFSSSRRA